MARFFTVYNPSNILSRDLDNNITKVANYHSRQVNMEAREECFEALGGRLKGVVLYRENEGKRLHYDLENKILVVLDGNPLINSECIDAIKINLMYQDVGIERMANILDGPYVILIVDENKEVLHLVRDRIGLKPLYYAYNDIGFICGSNSGAIIKSGLIKVSPNRHLIAKYCSGNFKSIYGTENTFFEGIELLAPKTILKYDKTGIRKQKFWDWDKKAKNLDLSDTEFNILLKDTITNCIKNYYYNDQTNNPIVALSGGVDSGTMIGILHEISKEKVDAISLSYREKTDFDESELIHCSARDHAKRWVDFKLDPNILLNDFQSLYERFDIPLATISIYGYDYLYREIARLGYRTVFTGAGGDYFQSGNYPCFLYNFADLKSTNSKDYYSEVKCWIENHSTSIYPKDLQTVQQFFDNNIDFTEKGKLKQMELFLNCGNIINKDLYREIGDVKSNVVDSYGSYQRSYIVQEFMYDAVPPGAEAEDLIDWFNGTSMTSPFFSKELIDLGWRLPSEQKIKNGINKVLSRKSLKGICSTEILKRIQKSGFNAPFDLWIRGPLHELAMDIFRSKSFLNRGIYDNKKFEICLNNHMNDNNNYMMLLWQALNLELWMRNWIDQN